MWLLQFDLLFVWGERLQLLLIPLLQNMQFTDDFRNANASSPALVQNLQSEYFFVWSGGF